MLKIFIPKNVVYNCNQMSNTGYMARNVFMRVDDEVKALTKEYIQVLEKEVGIKYNQRNAVKIALRRVLFK